VKETDMAFNGVHPGLHRSQRGVSLLFALLALAAMLLAAVGLVRSVDSGARVLGNLGFKQAATAAADRTAERARGVLAAPGFDLNTDAPAGNGYYHIAGCPRPDRPTDHRGESAGCCQLAGI
jgi:hypothetical protein